MKFAPILLASLSLVVSFFAFYESAKSNCAQKSACAEMSKEPAKKLVVVDFQDIFNAYRTQSGAEDQLNKAIEEANVVLNGKREELKTLLEAIKANQDELKKENIKEARLNEIKTEVTTQIAQVQQLNEFITQQTQIVQKNVYAESNRINQGLYSDLERIIKRKAQAQGYHYVINAQAQDATQTPVFLYSQETVDLTGEVMKEMNLKPTNVVANKTAPAIPREEKKEAK